MIEAIFDGRHRAYEPETVLVEFAGAITRRVKNGAELAPKVVSRLRTAITFRWERMNLDDAMDTATRLALRGMDAIVVAHALGAGLPLVTFDRDIRERAAKAVKILAPSDVLNVSR